MLIPSEYSKLISDMQKFWSHRGVLNFLLLPFAIFYWFFHLINFYRLQPKKVAAKVICLGNITIGGAGKTPLAIALGKALIKRGNSLAFISRGYKGSLSGKTPVKVDVFKHTYKEVGDEPLLLAKVAPTYICSNRYFAARMAEQDGAEVIIMDDGLQNNTIIKDLSILVCNGKYGLGNGMLLPSGPLRELPYLINKRIDYVFCYDKKLIFTDKKIFLGRTEIVTKGLKGRRFIALCAIANPEKFLTSLKQAGVRVAAKFTFPDHHPFTEAEIASVLAAARKHKAQIITTAKDYVRLPQSFVPDHFKILEIKTQLSATFLEEIRQQLLLK